MKGIQSDGFNQMERRDLSELVSPEMDVEVFRKEFDF